MVTGRLFCTQERQFGENFIFYSQLSAQGDEFLLKFVAFCRQILNQGMQLVVLFMGCLQLSRKIYALQFTTLTCSSCHIQKITKFLNRKGVLFLELAVTFCQPEKKLAFCHIAGMIKETGGFSGQGFDQP